MLRGAVALVDLEAIAGNFFGQADHQAVAGDLGHNGRQADDRLRFVASDYGFLPGEFRRRFERAVEQDPTIPRSDGLADWLAHKPI